MILSLSRKTGRKIRGDLASLSIAEILQALQLGMKTARLTLTSRERTGCIWIENGMIKNATTGQLKGEEALFQLLFLKRGGFIVDSGCRTDSRTIKENTEFLLLEGMRRVDEAEARKKEETVGRGSDLSTRRERSPRWARQKFDSAFRIRLVAGMVTLILTLLVAVAIWLDSAPSAVGSSTRAVSKMEAPQPVINPPDPDTETIRPPQSHALVGPDIISLTKDSSQADPPEEAALPLRDQGEILPPEPVEPILTDDQPVAALNDPSTIPFPPDTNLAIIEFIGKSHMKEGFLTLLVDGEVACSIALSGGQGKAKRMIGRLTGTGGERFQASWVVPPGSHHVIARLELPGKSTAHERALDIEIDTGASRSVRVVLGKSFGRRISLKAEPPENTHDEQTTLSEGAQSN